MIKKCIKCNEEKNIDDFSRDKNKKDGHSYICKTCSASYLKSYYTNNRQKLIDDALVRKNQVKKKNRGKMLAYLKSCPCKDCGNSDVRVLEFDHLGNKRKSVNEMLQEGYAWNTILGEIAKCDVVCSNCHKIRTYDRMETYRNN